MPLALALSSSLCSVYSRFGFPAIPSGVLMHDDDRSSLPLHLPLLLLFLLFLYAVQVWEKMRTLEAAARSELVQQGFKPEDVYCQAYLNLRFQGTDTALMTPASPPLHKAPEPGGGGGSGGSGADEDALQSFFGQYR